MTDPNTNPRRSTPTAPTGADSRKDEALTVADVFLEAGMPLPSVAYLDAPQDLRTKISETTTEGAAPAASPDGRNGRPIGTDGPRVVLRGANPVVLDNPREAEDRTLTLAEVVSLVSLRGWAMIAAVSVVVSIMAFASAASDVQSFALASAALAFALPSLTVIDLKVLRLPVVIVYPTSALIAVIALASLINGHIGPMELLAGTAAAVGIGGYHWLLHALTNSLGLGDVKVAALASFVLGVHDPLLALLSIVMAPPLLMIPVLGLMAIRGQKQVPFGPALAVGTFLGLALPGVFSLLLGPFAV